MYKVKLFSTATSRLQELENRANDFLSMQKIDTIKDIKFNIEKKGPMNEIFLIILYEEENKEENE